MESMSKIEAVLFDLDGTLLDSFPDFLASLENINIKIKYHENQTIYQTINDRFNDRIHRL